LTPTRRNWTAFSLVAAFILLVAVAVLGWWNFVAAQMVERGEIREACYLAIAFDQHFEQHGTGPTSNDVKSFPSRLRFLRIEDDRYLFACGLYGRDQLVVEHTGSGRFEFSVIGNGNL